MSNFLRSIWQSISRGNKQADTEPQVDVPSVYNGNSNTVYYIGAECDEQLVSIITNNLKHIVKILNALNCRFVFYPADKFNLLQHGGLLESLAYYHPRWRGNENVIDTALSGMSAHKFYESVCLHYKVKSDTQPFFLLHSPGYPNTTYRISLENVQYDHLKDAIELINGQIDKRLFGDSIFDSHDHDSEYPVNDVSSYNPDLYNSSTDEGKEYNADEEFAYEAAMISQSVSEQLKVLIRNGHDETIMGIYNSFLHQLRKERPSLFKAFELTGGLLTPTDLSRLVIDRHGKILLPDYNNLEIKLSPLPKTLYLFFLRNPEGMMFHDLVEHKKELLAIYSRITNSDNKVEIEKRISELTDIRSNSVNEKCSRIKEAFIKEMHDDVAKHYYVTGGRGIAKRISLPRDLVQISLEFK